MRDKNRNAEMWDRLKVQVNAKPAWRNACTMNYSNPRGEKPGRLAAAHLALVTIIPHFTIFEFFVAYYTYPRIWRTVSVSSWFRASSHVKLIKSLKFPCSLCFFSRGGVNHSILSSCVGHATFFLDVCLLVVLCIGMVRWPRFFPLTELWSLNKELLHQTNISLV